VTAQFVVTEEQDAGTLGAVSVFVDIRLSPGETSGISHCGVRDNTHVECLVVTNKQNDYSCRQIDPHRHGSNARDTEIELRNLVSQLLDPAKDKTFNERSIIGKQGHCGIRTRDKHDSGERASNNDKYYAANISVSSRSYPRLPCPGST